VVGGQPGGGMRRLKMAAALGREAVAWPSVGGRRRAAGPRLGQMEEGGWMGCVGQ
jgi:hypothetical protein